MSSPFSRVGIKAKHTHWYHQFCVAWDNDGVWVARRVLKKFSKVYAKLCILETPRKKISSQNLYELRQPHADNSCLTCGEPTAFNKEKRAWASYCSRKCMNESAAVVSSRRKTCLQKYGADNPSRVEQFKNERTKTIQQRFGVVNAFQSETIKAAIKTTLLDRYGVEHISQSREIQKLKQQNSLEKWGETHWTKTKVGRTNTRKMNTPECQGRARATCVDKYGFDKPFKATAIQDKCKATCMDRYGFDNALKVKAIRDKAVANSLTSVYRKYKIFVDKNNKTHKVVGYEHHALEWLSRQKNVRSITTNFHKLPNIKYQEFGKTRTYHPDMVAFTVGGGKHLIEVNSNYTLAIDLDNIVRKCQAATRFMKKRSGHFWLLLVDDHKNVHMLKDPTTKQKIVKAFSYHAPKLSECHHRT